MNSKQRELEKIPQRPEQIVCILYNKTAKALLQTNKIVVIILLYL